MDEENGNESERQRASDETDNGNDSEISLHTIIKLQSWLRRYKARKECLDLLTTRYEKIYDPRRKKYFYYDIIRDLSSWKKPKLLKDQDIQKVSSLYSQEEAIILIQKFFRKIYSLRKVRMLFQQRIKIKRDTRQKKLTTYFNKVTKQTFSKLPNFMEGRLNYDYELNDFEDKKEMKLKKKKEKKESESESESEESEDNLGNSDGGNVSGDDDANSVDSDSSSVVKAKRIAARIHPRSSFISLIP